MMYCTRVLKHTYSQTSIDYQVHRIVSYSLLRNLIRTARLYDRYPLLIGLLVNPNKSISSLTTLWPPKLLNSIDHMFHHSKYIIPALTTDMVLSDRTNNSLTNMIMKQYRKYPQFTRSTQLLVQDTFYLLRYLQSNIHYASSKLHLHTYINQLQSVNKKWYTQQLYHSIIDINPLLPPVKQSHINVPSHLNFIPLANTTTIQPGMFLVSHPQLGSEINSAVWAQTVVLIISVDQYNTTGVVINQPAQSSTIGTHIDVRKQLDQIIYNTIYHNNHSQSHNTNDNNIELISKSELMYGGPKLGYRIIHRIPSMEAWSNTVIESSSNNSSANNTTQSVYLAQSDFIEQLSQRTDINTINPSDILIYSSYSTWANKQLQHELNDGCWAILSGNSNHIFADFTAAHPVGIDEDAPAPIYDNVTDESDQTSNNHILSIPYNKLWQLAWYNHSTIGKYYSHCPLMRNSATPTQALLQQKTVDTIQLSSDITGHNTSHKSKHHTNDNDEHNTE